MTQRDNITSTEANPVIAQANEALTAGRLSEACALFEAAVSAWPHDGDLYTNYAAALFGVGRFDAAESMAREATRLSPKSSQAWGNLGTAIQSQGGRTLDAVSAYRTALELEPTQHESRVNLALAYETLGDVQAAGRLLVETLRAVPTNVNASYHLGRILVERRQASEALPHLVNAAKYAPQDAEIANVLGIAFRQLGRGNEAIREYRRAAALRPDFLAAYVNLSRACKELGYLDAAVHAGRTAVRLAPESPEAMNNLASALRSQGKSAEAAQMFAKAADHSNDPRPASNRLCAEQYIDAATRPRLKSLHAEWGNRFASEPPREHFANDRREDKPLRIGFVSPDFGQHPVGFFLEGLFTNLDTEAIETVCYSDRVARDAMTARLQRQSDLWRETSGISDAYLAKQIRADRVDILIDLAGHTDSNRLQIFADRAAPIQATWLGYVGTTGVPAIDYVIADSVHVRPEEDGDYGERILRMPNDYLCYTPPKAPEVSPLPALTSGRITFGAFHNPAKISPETVKRWSEILLAVPHSRILFKYWGFDTAGVKQHMKSQFASHGVNPTRLGFSGSSPLHEHLAAFEKIDIMLDPLPYSGGLTTLESIWMGVPVITMPGETFAGRHATSHMTHGGFPQFVAYSEQRYQDLAIDWASNLTALSELRGSMRQTLADSTICDGEQFAADFSEQMRAIWHDHVGSDSAETRRRTVA